MAMKKVIGWVAAAALLWGAAPVGAQSLTADEILSTVSVRAISAPNPVRGADGRVHLAYELLFGNPSRLFVTLDRVEAVDPAGRSLWSLEGAGLAAMTEGFGPAAPLPPGGSAAVFMDVSFAEGEVAPAEVAARVTLTRQVAGPDGKPAPLPAGAPVPATVSFVGARTPVGTGAVVVAAPLRGKGWVAVNGCCDSITSHRGAVMAVNGALRVPERFAIDFVQIGSDGRLFAGDGKVTADYRYYGVPVHAVADGTVVNLYDAAADQVPGQITGITTENIGGNMIVTDIGGGNFAFYAHLKPGSLKVALGDRVRAGDVLALLGNSGNTTAPHLHFHVMDGPSPLDANGLPYVIAAFSSRGTLEAGSEDEVENGKPARIDAARDAGVFRAALPLNDQVVDFPD